MAAEALGLRVTVGNHNRGFDGWRAVGARRATVDVVEQPRRWVVRRFWIEQDEGVCCPLATASTPVARRAPTAVKTMQGIAPPSAVAAMMCDGLVERGR